MHRTWAIVERELRRFRRSPMLIVMSMIFPLMQLVVLGYAFGGNVKHLKLAIVDQDHGVPAVRVRELASAVSSGARTVDLLDYTDSGEALTDLRNGVLAMAAAGVAISNDSGLMHIAAALGTPTMGIFGPTSPYLWAPLNGLAATVVQNKSVLSCQPCQSTICRMNDHRCMRDISAGEVVAIAQRVLGENASRATT